MIMRADSWRGTALLTGACLLAGCAGWGGPGGALQLESLGREAAVLKSSLDVAVYSHGQSPETSFVLTDIPPAALLSDSPADGQLIHIDLLWEPKPGATPLDRTATNAAIRYVVLVGREVGVYGGAGFVRPRGVPGSAARLTVTVRDSSLRLMHATPGFVDRMGTARLSGSFTAARDDAQARRLRYAASQRVTNALGRSVYVLDDESAGEAQALIESILTRR
jgi:hypothetical protein